MLEPTIKKYGKNAILIEWEATIRPDINDQVVAMANYIQENHTEFLLEIVPSYQSLVVFLKDGIDIDRYLSVLSNDKIARPTINFDPTIWRVPVCYDSTFALDLDGLLKTKNLSHEKVIKLHTAPHYRIYGIGFLPGFLYLGGLNEQLFSPRKRHIKRFAPKGSVAIGDKQTGIYPQESPGGWNIIGRTPVELFNTTLNPPTPFTIGDSVCFYSIDEAEFNKIEGEVSNGNYHLKSIGND